ncbi:MAG: cyclic-di-AMP receptor [Chloroflexi bacterium]|nr:cyclic-di-AMP receptor [Chloroflexota bacterium]
MKLITAIVQDEDTNQLLDALVRRGYRATRVSSTGGFLRSGNSTVLIGVEDHLVDDVIGIVEENCHTRIELTNPLARMGPGEFYMPEPVEVQVGGATIFVQAVERYIRV